MSTYYRPTEKIPLSKIKKLKEFKVIYDKEQNKELFFDGKNYLHFATDKKNNVIDVFRYGGNDETTILDSLESNFEIEMISEHDKGYSHFQDEDTKVINISIER
tara:strand:+ start:4100 stop:4411 length:312 start_codon:yes stop_codon:yes gene_type:complete